MAELLEFEVRPIEGATAVVGEEVTFRSEGGRLYALNEDGEAFGVVPAKFARQLEGLGEVTATVAGRSGGIPTVSVEVPVGPAPEDVAATAPVEASAEAEEDQAEAPDEFAQKSEDAASASEVETESKVEAPQGETDADKIEFAESDAPTVQADTPIDAATDSTAKKKSKTKYIAIAAVAAVVIVIVVCVGLFSGGATQVATQTVTSDWLSIEVPEDWTVEEYSYSYTNGAFYRIYSEDPEFYVFVSDPGQINAQVDALYEELEDFDEDDGAEKLEDLTIDGAIVHRYQVDSKDFAADGFPDDYELSGDTVEMAGYEYYFYSGGEYIYILTYCFVDEYDEDVEELETILDSVVLEGASEPEVEMQAISVSDGEISIEVPAGWTVEEETSSDSSDLVSADLDSYQFCGPQKALLQTGYSLSGMEDIDSALLVYETIFGLDSSTREQSEYGDGAIVCTYDYSYTDEDNETDMAGYFEIVFSGDSASIVVAACEEDELSLNSEMLEAIVDSLTIENPSEPVFSGAEDGSTETEAAGELEETQTITDGSYSIEVPASWIVEEQELDDDATCDAMFIGLSMDETQEVVFETGIPISGTGSLDTVLYVFETSLDLEADSLEQSTTDDGTIVCRYDYAGDGVAGYCKILLSGDSSAALIVICAEDELSENAETFEAILDSLTVSNPSAPSF